MRITSVVTFLAVLLVATFASAEEIAVGAPGFVPANGPVGVMQPSGGPMGPDTYGTGSYTAVAYGTVDFTPLEDGEWAHFLGSTGWSYRDGGTNTATCTGIHLPSGALWEGVTLQRYDTDAAANLAFGLYKQDIFNNAGSTLMSQSTSGDTGDQTGYFVFTTAETVTNANVAYYACYFSSVTTSALRHAGVTAFYRLQITPAPVTATFLDVPVGAFGFQHIEALNASGITGGCGGGNFCPNDPLTRAQMAVFLSKALGLHWAWSSY